MPTSQALSLARPDRWREAPYFATVKRLALFVLNTKQSLPSSMQGRGRDAIALLFAERHALELRHVAAWG
jgi:hypothetical protein